MQPPNHPTAQFNPQQQGNVQGMNLNGLPQGTPPQQQQQFPSNAPSLQQPVLQQSIPNQMTSQPMMQQQQQQFMGMNQHGLPPQQAMQQQAPMQQSAPVLQQQMHPPMSQQPQMNAPQQQMAPAMPQQQPQMNDLQQQMPPGMTQQQQMGIQPHPAQPQIVPPQQQQMSSQSPLPPIATTPQRGSAPYELTQAQLSPPAKGGLPQAKEIASTLATTVGSNAKKVKSKVVGLFAKDPNKPNLGFSPTPRMIQQHEKRELIPSERPLYQFQVTKLRNWRTGYLRLLVLYPHDFATLDPNSEDETNRWPYNALTDWQDKGDSTILLTVGNDSLKLSVLCVHRAHVLTALLECRQIATGGSMLAVPSFAPIDRYTRHGTTQTVQLQVQEYGLTETDAGRPLQTYRYADIVGITMTPEDPNGLVIHFRQINKSRLYRLPRRQDFIQKVHAAYFRLGLEWPQRAQPTPTIGEWIQMRRSLDIGTVLTVWPMRKSTRRHATGVASRQLVLTSKSLLVEKDGGTIVSCRRLVDVAAMVRCRGKDEVRLEFCDGSFRIYANSNRDAFIVALIDACSSVTNPLTGKIHVADLLDSSGFGMISFARSALAATVYQPAATTAAAAMFQPLSLPSYALQKVYACSTQAYAYVSHLFAEIAGLEIKGKDPIDVVQQCTNLLESCREFNASVLSTGDGLPQSEKDKSILGSLGALWGLVAALLRTNPNKPLREETLSSLLQSIYRLSQTPTGYTCSAELTTLQNALSVLFHEKQSLEPFSMFWAIRVIGVLVSGTTERDLEAEYVNKSVVLKCGGESLAHGIVSSLIDTRLRSDVAGTVSDLILMAASDVLQSILCSHHDTTSPEHFTSFIQILATQ